MRKPIRAAAAALAAFILCGFLSCESSGPTTVTGSGPTSVPVRGGADPLPAETPVGGEIVHPTPTSIPSRIPPTPARHG